MSLLLNKTRLPVEAHFIAPAVAGGLIIGGSAILGGLLGSSGSSDAGEAGAAASRYAADVGYKQYEQTRADLAPWREMGEDALNILSQKLGLPYYEMVPTDPTTRPADPNYGQPYYNPEEMAQYQAELAAYKVNPYMDTDGLFEGAMRQRPRPRKPTPIMPGEAGYPYSPEGMTSAGFERTYRPGTGELQMGEFEASPSYQFVKDEAERAMTNALSASGKLRSGAHVRAAGEYAQNLASTEYDNFLRRWYQSLTPYQSMAGVGQTTGVQLGQLGAQNAAQAGQAALTGGAYQAGAAINRTNALTGMITGGANNLLYLNAQRNLPQQQSYTPVNMLSGFNQPGFDLASTQSPYYGL